MVIGHNAQIRYHAVARTGARAWPEFRRVPGCPGPFHDAMDDGPRDPRPSADARRALAHGGYVQPTPPPGATLTGPCMINGSVDATGRIVLWRVNHGRPSPLGRPVDPMRCCRTRSASPEIRRRPCIWIPRSITAPPCCRRPSPYRRTRFDGCELSSSAARLAPSRARQRCSNVFTDSIR